MADWTIKQHDTWPPLSAQLKDAAGNIDLTTATQVKLLAKTSSGTTSWSGVCTITDAVAGRVSYNLLATPDTASINTYNAEFEITWASGKISTVPNKDYFTIEVVADLG